MKKEKRTDDAGYAAAFSASITSRPCRKNIFTWVKMILFLNDYDKSVICLNVRIVYNVHVYVITIFIKIDQFFSPWAGFCRQTKIW